jgi:TRAP-type transport system periplasmic protein
MKRHYFVPVALVAWAAFASGVNAETVKLTVVSASPPQAAPVKATRTSFIPEVNRLLAASGQDFKIEWVEAYSGTLANINQVFDTVERGIAQIGVIIYPFVEAKIPLAQVSLNIPFASEDPLLVTKVFEEMHDSIPEMRTSWNKYNQVYLGTMVTDSYQIMTKFPIQRYEDLRGRRIGGSGGAAYLQNTGGVVVDDTLIRAYSNIQNGLYEGYVSPVSLMVTFKVNEVAPYLTKANIGALAAAGLSMNKTAFEKLPPFAQKAFLQAGRMNADYAAKDAIQAAQSYEAAAVKTGIKVQEMSTEERRRWVHVLPNLPKAWAQRVDQLGQPGTRALQAYMDGLRAAGAPILRHWDKE